MYFGLFWAGSLVTTQRFNWLVELYKQNINDSVPEMLKSKESDDWQCSMSNLFGPFMKLTLMTKWWTFFLFWICYFNIARHKQTNFKMCFVSVVVFFLSFRSVPFRFIWSLYYIIILAFYNNNLTFDFESVIVMMLDAQ